MPPSHGSHINHGSFHEPSIEAIKSSLTIDNYKEKFLNLIYFEEKAHIEELGNK